MTERVIEVVRKTMNILFDYRAFGDLAFGGVPRYFVELATHLMEIEGVDVSMFAPLHLNEELQMRKSLPIFGVRVREFRGVRRLIRPSNELLMRARLSTSSADIVHETYYPMWRQPRKRMPVVTTVHDMIHELFVDPSSIKDGHKVRAVERADKVICVSEHTKRDLIDIFGTDPGKIAVVHHGSSFRERASAIGSSPRWGPYLLYVGRRHVDYKNFRRMVAAYASSRTLREAVKLVCFGGERVKPQDIDFVKEVGLPDGQVIFVPGYEHDLASLYTHATGLVYPSLYEGFGLPPLEAMSMGCAVICSNSSSIPEVVGDAGEYFDPTDIEAMRQAMENVVLSDARRGELRGIGLRRASEFAWAKCARETLGVYQSLV